MSQISALIAGKNKNYDYQLSALARLIINSGVSSASGLEVTSGSVASGEAFILCTRTNGQKIMLHYQNTAAVTIDTTGTTKVWIGVDQSVIDDGSSNALDGTGIATIRTGVSYPAGNYIPLASIVSGVITDERKVITRVGLLDEGYGVNKTKYIDPTTGNEILVDSTVGSSIPDTAIVEWRDQTTGDVIRVPYSVVKADMALSGGGSFSITPYEASIAPGDPVGLLPDGLYECTTENKSSTNITASSITGNHGQIEISPGKYIFFYSVGVNLFVRAGTLSGDVMTYGTQEAVDTLTTANCTGGIAKIGTDKFILVYADSNTASITRHKAGTISGTAITLGSVVTQVHQNGYAVSISHVVRVRDDAYFAVYQLINNYVGRIHTVSGTTITLNGTNLWSYNNNYGGVNAAYLSDNMLGLSYSYYTGSVYQSLNYIYAITPGGTTAATTYSGALVHGGGYFQPFIARYSDDSFVLTLAGANTNTFLVPKPPSGTTITVQTLFDNGASKFLPVFALSNNIFATLDGTTLNVYQEKTLIGSITGITTFGVPSYMYSQQTLGNGRFVYLAGVNGTSRIINFAIVFYFGVANNATGGVLLRGTITKAGVLMGLFYYLQADGSIGIAKTAKYVGKGIAANTLLAG